MYCFYLCIVFNFEMTKNDIALSAQARFYVYSKQKVSKQTFNNNVWIQLIERLYKTGRGTLQKTL